MNIFEKNLNINMKKSGNQITSFVIYELYRLIKTSLDNENSTITPTSFKILIGQKNDIWDEMNQQDMMKFKLKNQLMIKM
jgi:uncharacterized UBP type Zn finger protein